LSKLSAIRSIKADSIATASLSVETSGEGFFEITPEVTRFLKQVGAGDGALLIYLRHTSASLVIQENADPDVRTDLVTALRRLAPADAGCARRRGAGRHAGACQIHAQRRVLADTGQRRRFGVRHLAGNLRRRASQQPASARGGPAILRILRQQ
jgi:secondary thiamine-phosphate synthase enzyme